MKNDDSTRVWIRYPYNCNRKSASSTVNHTKMLPMPPKTCNRNHEISLKDQIKVISYVSYGRRKTFFFRMKYTYMHPLARDISIVSETFPAKSPLVSNLTQKSWQDEPDKNCLPGLLTFRNFIRWCFFRMQG